MTHKPTVLIVGEGLDEAHDILPKAPRGRLRGLLRALICRRCGLFGPANDRLRYCQPGHALLRGTVRAAAGHRKGSTPASSRGGTLSGYGGLFGGYASRRMGLLGTTRQRRADPEVGNRARLRWRPDRLITKLSHRWPGMDQTPSGRCSSGMAGGGQQFPQAGCVSRVPGTSKSGRPRPTYRMPPRTAFMANDNSR